MSARCPVCERPLPDGDRPPGTRCAECGWLLSGEHQAGDLGALQAGYDRALAGARRLADARAAARAFTVMPADFYGELRELIRGGGLDDQDELRVMLRARDERAEAGGPRAAAGALRALVDGDLPAATFLAFDHDGVHADTAVIDGRGYPVTAGEPWFRPWRKLITTLAEEPIRQAFRLAGGVLEDDRLDRVTAAGDVAGRLPDLAGHGVVIVRRVIGWGLVEQVIDHLAGRLDVRATVADVQDRALRSIVEEILAELPLRYPIAVLAAGRDPHTGALAPVAVQLFAPGARPGTIGTTTLFAPPMRTDGVALPLVAVTPGGRPGEAEPVRGQGRVPISTVRLAVPAGARIELVVRLSERREPEVTQPAGTTTDDRPLAGLVEALPATLPAPRPLDLACTVELGGDPAAVQARLDLLRQLIEEAAARCPLPGVLRVGVVGYADHPYERTRIAGARFLHDAAGDDPAAVLARVGGWAPDPAWTHGHTTSVEDALHRAASLGWRPGVPRALLMLGTRPPCAARPGGAVRACPYELDWLAGLRALAAGGPLRRFAVIEPAGTWAAGGVAGRAAAQHAVEFWRQVHGGEPPDAAAVQHDRALAVLGLPAKNAGRQFPLALTAPVPVAGDPSKEAR